MRLFSCLIIILIGIFSDAHGQLIPISDARALPVGSTVTVNGIVTAGPEFGTIRFMQDGTGGIAIYSTSLATVQRGDNITVSGQTVQFQNLLEMNPVNFFQVNSTGNSDPTPLLVSLSQVDESNESMLVKVNNVNFLTSGTFQGNTNYNVTSNGESGIVYIRSASSLVGQPIPSTAVNIVGVNSQYGSIYEISPRDMNDITLSTSISIISQPVPSNITTTGFDISWKTDLNGNSFLRYGHTPSLELGIITGPVNTVSPSVTVTGGSPSQIFYVQALSVSGTDTAKSAVKPYITKSNSSGTIRVYFDRAVDQSVANPPSNLAIRLQDTFDDTLKAYIDRATTTLDIAIYSFDDSGTALITQAINDAYARGVRIRIITDSGNVNAGLQTINSNIPVLPSPNSSPFYYGIMHNKFFIADAESTNPNQPVVMTGSTNWSNSQLYTDRNNLLFIQDQSLAKVYQMEFEEMWGGNGAQPNLSNSKFGPDKTDNTPHFINVGGKMVESYFSPSDNTNNQIVRAIETADEEIYFATMVYTRYDLAYAMEDRFLNHGVYGAGIMNDSSNGSGTSFQIIQGVIGSNMILFDHPNQPGILHHKYMIVDQANGASNSLVLTGSHNWSSAANQRNDENTVIIYDQLIANQYYQEFHNLFNTNGGAVGLADDGESNMQTGVFPNPASNAFNLVVQSEWTGEGKIFITDISGRKIFEQSATFVNGENKFHLDIASLPDGMYFVIVSGRDRLQATKLLIRK